MKTVLLPWDLVSGGIHPLLWSYVDILSEVRFQKGYAVQVQAPVFVPSPSISKILLLIIIILFLFVLNYKH